MDYRGLAMRVLEEEARANLKGLTSQGSRDVLTLAAGVQALAIENEWLRLDNWDMKQELETRVAELVRLLGELPDEAQEIREEATSELTCIEETLKRCGA